MQRDIVIGHKIIRVEQRTGSDRALWTINGDSSDVDAQKISINEISLLVDGRAYRCLFDRTPNEEAVVLNGKRYVFTVEDPRALKSRKQRGTGADGPLAIKSSMPGRVLRMLVAEGDEVSAGQGVMVVEAMKMQNEMKTTRGGRVRRIAVNEGETVNAGQLLAVIE